MEFKIGYKDFQTNAKDVFQALWNDRQFSDVTLVTGDDKEIRAHKIILCSNSIFFKNIFRRYPYHNPLIYLKDIKYKYLDWIIEFIYTGKYDIKVEELVLFLSLGKELGVIGLLEEIVNYDNILMENYFSEVHSKKRVEIRSEQKEATSRDIFYKKGKRMNNPSSQQGNVRFVCNECDAVYRHNTGLFQHIRSVHEGVKYDCNQCDTTFNRQDSLSRHMKFIHRGLKYDCNQCDSTFTWLDSFKIHIKAVHQGVTYNCNQCNYRATTLGNLNAHKRSIHQGIKYDCYHCDHRATTQSSLTRHIQSLHE